MIFSHEVSAILSGEMPASLIPVALEHAKGGTGGSG